jgi:hypothetical protein
MQNSYTGEEKWCESDVGNNYSPRSWQSITGLFESHGRADDSKAGEGGQVEISQDSILAMAEDQVDDWKHKYAVYRQLCCVICRHIGQTVVGVLLELFEERFSYGLL